MGSPLPICRDVPQGQPDQLGGRIVAGEVASRLDDFSQVIVDALDRIGGVDHAAHRRRERKERDYGPRRGGPGVW